jgi:hypothetical protein
MTETNVAGKTVYKWKIVCGNELHYFQINFLMKHSDEGSAQRYKNS